MSDETQEAPKAETSKETPNYVYEGRVKEFLKKQGFKSSADVHDALNEKVEALLKGAIEKAKEDKRVTLKGRDF